ncbi:MAG TPA: DUF4241 domain-containing protein [Longimicrobium sp.]|nr:DUF4241 domain-containing protein [Longimicrobium sp.]
MATLDPEHALQEGPGPAVEGRTPTLKLRTLGELVLPTGRIVACDPFSVFGEEGPFTRSVAPGRYPVLVNVAAFENHERVAYAISRFGERPPVRWEMALLAGQDAGTLGEGEFFGYGVDAGTGCFMDAQVARVLAERSTEENDYNGDLVAAMEKTYVDTWSWLDFVLDPATGANVVAFSSGWGDGSYPSFWGFDETGAVACLVTDFGIFWPEAEG